MQSNLEHGRYPLRRSCVVMQRSFPIFLNTQKTVRLPFKIWRKDARRAFTKKSLRHTPIEPRRRGDHILRFCGMARRVRRSQGEVRRQSLEEIELCWKKGIVKMESLSEFTMEMRKGDHFISIDIHKGY